MEKLQLSIPSMWADHHVLKVRDVLVHLDGVRAYTPVQPGSRPWSYLTRPRPMQQQSSNRAGPGGLPGQDGQIR